MVTSHLLTNIFERLKAFPNLILNKRSDSVPWHNGQQIGRVIGESQVQILP